MTDDREIHESYRIEAPSVTLDIPIRFRTQEESLAYYDPETDGIVASYKLRDSDDPNLIRACLRHEGSHALVAGLTQNQQDILVSAILKNEQAKPQFVAFLKSFLKNYKVSTFIPEDPKIIRSHKAIKISGVGYHHPDQIMSITIKDKRFDLSAIAIIDELLAWATTNRSRDERYFPNEDWEKGAAATKVIEALDENTKFLLTSMGFININADKLVENFKKEVEVEYELF